MSVYEQEKQKNMEAYNRLKEEFQTKYEGQYVAIADGRLIKVSPSFDEADRAVRNYRHRLVFPVGDEPEIGSLRVRCCRVEGTFG